MAINPIKIGVAMKDYLSAQEASLPRLADVEVLTPRVARILGGNPGEMQLQGTNTFLVGNGRSRILIDTGQGMESWITNFTKFLEDEDLDLSHILITHWHGDHTGGISDLIRYRPEYASRIYKNNPDPGQQAINDNQVFVTEGATIRAVFTPGHADDHMCFILTEENAMFTGDNVLGHGYSVSEDLGLYMKSLRHMGVQNCSIGYPAHGITITNLPAQIRRYIRHREVREHQIHRAMTKYEASKNATVAVTGQQEKNQPSARTTKVSITVRELVSLVHGDLADESVKVALEPSMVEVLWKLAADQKVGFEMKIGSGRRWFLKEALTLR